VSACSSSGKCSQHRMRTVRRRIYAAHLTVCRGLIEQLVQVEIDAFPIAFVTDGREQNLPTQTGFFAVLRKRHPLVLSSELPSPPSALTTRSQIQAMLKENL
jgi:hypothetical protein